MNKELRRLQLESLLYGATTIFLVILLIISQNIVYKYSLEERLTKFELLFIAQLVLTILFMFKIEKRLQDRFKELREKISL
jgi:hypothetical protein